MRQALTEIERELALAQETLTRNRRRGVKARRKMSMENKGLAETIKSLKLAIAVEKKRKPGGCALA